MSFGEIWITVSNFSYWLSFFSIPIFVIWFFLDKENFLLLRKSGMLKTLEQVMTDRSIFQIISVLWLLPWVTRGWDMLKANHFVIPDIIMFFVSSYCLSMIFALIELRIQAKSNPELNKYTNGIKSKNLSASFLKFLSKICFWVSGAVIGLFWLFFIQGHNPITEDEMITVLVIIGAISLAINHVFEKWVKNHLSQMPEPIVSNVGFRPSRNTSQDAEYEFSEEAFRQDDPRDPYGRQESPNNRGSREAPSEDPFFNEQRARKEQAQAEQKRRNEEWERNVQREREAKQEKERAEKEYRENQAKQKAEADRYRREQQAPSKPQTKEGRDRRNGRFNTSRFSSPRKKQKYEAMYKAVWVDKKGNPSEKGKQFTLLEQADQGMQEGIEPWEDPEI